MGIAPFHGGTWRCRFSISSWTSSANLADLLVDVVGTHSLETGIGGGRRGAFGVMHLFSISLPLRHSPLQRLPAAWRWGSVGVSLGRSGHLRRGPRSAAWCLPRGHQALTARSLHDLPQLRFGARRLGREPASVPARASAPAPRPDRAGRCRRRCRCPASARCSAARGHRPPQASRRCPSAGRPCRWWSGHRHRGREFARGSPVSRGEIDKGGHGRAGRSGGGRATTAAAAATGAPASPDHARPRRWWAQAPSTPRVPPAVSAVGNGAAVAGNSSGSRPSSGGTGRYPNDSGSGASRRGSSRGRRADRAWPLQVIFDRCHRVGQHCPSVRRSARRQRNSSTSMKRTTPCMSSAGRRIQHRGERRRRLQELGDLLPWRGPGDSHEGDDVVAARANWPRLLRQAHRGSCAPQPPRR